MDAPQTVSWRLSALCRGADPETFFPKRGESTRPAKAICAGCPVKMDCLEDAIIRNEPAGVRGGRSLEERKKLKRKAVKAGIPLPKADSYSL